MKLLIKSAIAVCLLTTLTAATALGKTRKASVVFSADTQVNGKLVKEGMYKAVFDDQSGELSIWKGTKLTAKTSGRLERRDQKVRGVQVQTIMKGMDRKLVSITFGDGYDKLVVGEASMQAGGN